MDETFVTTSYQESGLQFTFNEKVTVVKYDDCDFVRRKINRMQQCQAVDFLLKKDKTMVLLEVKNFSGDSAQLQTKMQKSPNDGQESDKSKRRLLRNALVQKTRDTILGLVIAWRRQNDELNAFSRHLVQVDAENKLHLIFLLDNIDSNGVSALTPMDKADFIDLALHIGQRVNEIVDFVTVLGVDDFPQSLGRVIWRYGN